jgi:hypothetical protein
MTCFCIVAEAESLLAESIQSSNSQSVPVSPGSSWALIEAHGEVI